MTGLMMGGMLCTLAQEDLMLNDGARPEAARGLDRILTLSII